MTATLDWAGLLSFALRDLRLRPDDFWALTPGELALIAGVTPGEAAPLTRDWFEALSAHFPDKDKR
ncbi:MAG: phage tail assembly chaperone [Pseudomonadota bacterium]